MSQPSVKEGQRVRLLRPVTVFVDRNDGDHKDLGEPQTIEVEDAVATVLEMRRREAQGLSVAEYKGDPDD